MGISDLGAVMVAQHHPQVAVDAVEVTGVEDGEGVAVTGLGRRDQRRVVGGVRDGAKRTTGLMQPHLAPTIEKFTRNPVPVLRGQGAA